MLRIRTTCALFKVNTKEAACAPEIKMAGVLNKFPETNSWNEMVDRVDKMLTC